MANATQKRLDQVPQAMILRRQTVEHPFGIIKAWMGSTHFLRKTLKRFGTETTLHVLTALRNADGSLTYLGRADDVFKSSGYRISLFELESVLIEHPAVAEAAVVPSPDATRGALPKAFVLLAEGVAPHGDGGLGVCAPAGAAGAPYKRVRRLEFAELPKTISGKIRRVELRRLKAARRAEDGRGAAEFWGEG